MKTEIKSQTEIQASSKKCLLHEESYIYYDSILVFHNNNAHTKQTMVRLATFLVLQLKTIP